MLKTIAASKRPPLDLSARMAVCDGNYLRLLKLMPEVAQGQSRSILLPPVQEQHGAEHRLDILVLEAFRYTTTLSLTLVISEATPAWFRTPRLTVRLYHDAGTAEVTSYQDQRGFKAVYSEDEAPRFSWDEKNQINLFLAEWLALCLEGGLGRLTLPACLRALSPAETPAEAAPGN